MQTLEGSQVISQIKLHLSRHDCGFIILIPLHFKFCCDLCIIPRHQHSDYTPLLKFNQGGESGRWLYQSHLTIPIETSIVIYPLT